MKKIFLALALMLTLSTSAQTYARQGLQFTQSQVQAKDTGYTWKDSKGNVYPIYITDKGRCFIMKVSSKTGKTYKSYLPEDVSRTICAELGILYQEKK